MMRQWNMVASATDKHVALSESAKPSADEKRGFPQDKLAFSAPLPSTDSKETDLGNMRKEVPQTALERMKHVTKIIHHHHNKSSLASALLGHSKIANIVNGRSNWPSPPNVKKKSAALQKFKARARKLIEDERSKKVEEASVDAHPRLGYLNAQAYEYLRKCEYVKLQVVKLQEKIKRAKKARDVLWKLRREHQAKKDLERRWTPRDVEHREFDLVTAKQDCSITLKDCHRQKKKVDKMRRTILTKKLAKEQIQTYIDDAVRDQQRKVAEAHKLGAETDILAIEFDVSEKAERSLQLEWEQEYSTVCRETEQLERKSLDQRMKETKHLTSKAGAEINPRKGQFGLATILASAMGVKKGKINIVQEMRLRSQNSRLNWQVAKQKMFSKLRATSVKEAEDSMRKLMTETKIHDMDKLVEWFENNEKKNFGVFNELDKHETELNEVKSKILKLRKDLSMYSGHGNVVNHVKDQIAKRAQERILAFSRATQACKANFEHSNRLLTRLCPYVDSIFSVLGERDSDENSHLTMKGVTSLSIMGFLGIIDQRVAEILQFHDQMSSDDLQGAAVQQRLPGSSEQTARSPMRRPDHLMEELSKSVNPPSVREVITAARNDPSEAEDDFTSVPLTRDQLKLKGIDFFALRVQQREQKMVRITNQREQGERLAKRSFNSSFDNGTTQMSGAQLRRMRKRVTKPEASS